MFKNVGLTLLLVGTLAVGGCAFIKGAVDDYKLGKSTPVVEGEITPEAQVSNITEFVSALPYVGPYAGSLGGVLLGFFTWRRGRRLRKGLPVNTNPSTGFLGSLTGVEGLVQTMSSLITGAFEAGPDGSVAKRAWKMGLASALGLGTLALTIPSAREFVLGNPAISAGIVGLSSLFGGLEKALSKVQPVAPKP